MLQSAYNVAPGEIIPHFPAINMNHHITVSNACTQGRADTNSRELSVQWIRHQVCMLLPPGHSRTAAIAPLNGCLFWSNIGYYVDRAPLPNTHHFTNKRSICSGTTILLPFLRVLPARKTLVLTSIISFELTSGSRDSAARDLSNPHHHHITIQRAVATTRTQYRNNFGWTFTVTGNAAPNSDCTVPEASHCSELPQQERSVGQSGLQ